MRNSNGVTPMTGRMSKRGLGIAVAGGAAYATIPDAAGVYTACKLRITGTIRLIDKTPGAFPAGSLLARCTPFEDEITWSHTGPQGVQHSAGARSLHRRDARARRR